MRNGNALILGGLGISATIESAIINGGVGGGSLIKTGAGTLTLTSSNNTYNLGTTINGGTLDLASFGVLPPLTPLNINAAGSTFMISNLIPASSSIGDLTAVPGSSIFLGNKELIVNSSTITTCASQITGTGGTLTKQGSGTLILAGANSYSGGTNILDGTLQGDSTSLQGEIFNDAILTFNQTADGTFNGFFLGSGNINKNGAGTLNLVNESSAFGGTTSINQGKLTVNTILGGNVAVMAAGILSGNATIGNQLTVDGIVSPGNSIGTIVVNGNYLQNAGSTYNVQINGQGQSSLLDIVGTATLNPGAGVNFVSLDGSVNPDVTYLILHADGGLTGTYSNVTSSNLMIVPSLFYDPNNVFANFKRSFVVVTATRNQREVALQLESIVNPDPAEEALLTAITNLSIPEAQKVLDELSAQQYTNLLMTSELANRQFIRRMFNAIRPSLVYNPCACTCDYLGQYNVWVEGGYGMDQYKKKIRSVVLKISTLM
ncbi:MAG: autotransporter-associated beta strand repeat-containing protein [Parachlamydiaceae bacterium]|nr:MAG: autotransporter-associated beta strand repeat-containing protein [Parachlamydiaceae bacterium]